MPILGGVLFTGDPLQGTDPAVFSLPWKQGAHFFVAASKLAKTQFLRA
jgi:hypothetical protein